MNVTLQLYAGNTNMYFIDKRYISDQSLTSSVSCMNYDLAFQEIVQAI